MFDKISMFVVGIWISFSATNPTLASEVLHSWVQVGPDANVIARVITQAPRCPVIEIDGQPVLMQLRAAPQTNFPNVVCEYRAPKTALQITLEGEILPTLDQNIDRIAVIGDTGCRIRQNRVQDCKDPQAWPLQEIASQIASKSPDLIIHVGDYIYRSIECPEPAKCGGSPFGDTFETWSADWMGPAETLFSSAPFVFLRGNHENCGRGDLGWFRYFAPRLIPENCPTVTEPWITTIDDLDLIVFDSSPGPASQSSPVLEPEFRRMANRVFRDVSRETWFLTHRPLWVNMHAYGELIDGDNTQRAAFGDAIPKELSIVLSGHIHAFQAIDLSNGPVQWISGNGGTQLDPMPSAISRNIDVAGSMANIVINDDSFGFLLMDRKEDKGWTVDVVDEKGQLKFRCDLSEGRLGCE